jgi:exodeoxyribonuclease V alpha subunit
MKPQVHPEREALAGLVEHVTFHSPDSGFCVLRVEVRGHRGLVTVLGSAPTVQAGEYIHASGRWAKNRDHGLQFKAAFMRASFPTTLDGIEKYLGSGLIKGIGPHFAQRLVAEFGEGVFDLIEGNPTRVPCVRAFH